MNDTQAQADYNGDNEIVFSQQKVDETRYLQRQQQPSRAQGHHDKCVEESKESNSKAG